MLSLQQMATSFSLGLLATTAPYVLPLYPGFLAYLSSNSQGLRGKRLRYLLGSLVLLGVLTMMLLIGLVIASLSLAIGSFLAIATPVADTVIVSLGVMMLLNFNLFVKLAQVRTPVLSNPLLGAYVYGLLFGPVVLPCSGPVAVAVFTLSFSSASIGARRRSSWSLYRALASRFWPCSSLAMLNGDALPGW